MYVIVDQSPQLHLHQIVCISYKLCSCDSYCLLYFIYATYLIQAQYNFIHDVLNELILCGDTEILAPDLRRVINQLKDITDGQTGFCKQFAVSY